MGSPIIIAAVLYDPKVSVIWNIIRDFFEENGCPIDVVFYTNYELQVEALLTGDVDIAWNSPLAWLDAQRRSGETCRAIAMRDTDRDRATCFVARRGGDVKQLSDLRGRTLAVGARDSPQATLIPIGTLQRTGLEPGRDFQLRHFDVLLGKHGDHVGGELDAFRSLARGDADASVMLDLNWDGWALDGTINLDQFHVVARTDKFDHCVFTVASGFSADREAQWLGVLYSMSYNNPTHREMMDLEGLKQWLPGRTTGFGALSEAVERQDYFQRVPS